MALDQMPSSQDDSFQAATAEPASQNPGGFLGSLLMSAFACVFFSGLLAIQGTTYFRCFPNDNRWLKRLVGSVLFLSLLQAVSWIYLSWMWFVISFGDWAVFFRPSVTFTAEPIVSQLTISFAQAFFVYRCYILTHRNRFLVVLLVFGILASFALFIAFCVDLVVDLDSFAYRRILLLTTVPITMVTDIVITGVTTWILLTSRRGVNPRTDNGLSKLLQVTWEAAVPPAIAAVGNLLVLLYLSNTFVFIFFNILITRLYVFSLMFTLNSRPEVRRVFESDQAKRLSAWSSPGDSSTQARPEATTRIVFAPLHSGVTENNSALSTTGRIEIAEGVQESDGYELDEFVRSTPLTADQKEDEISDSGTATTFNDEPKPDSPLTSCAS